MGVFNRIFEGLVAEAEPADQLMIDTTHLKAHRTAASLLKKGVRAMLSMYRACQGRSELQAARRL